MSDARRSLLIVDDEETIHRALDRTLRREPYERLHAYDAAEAWAILQQNPDVVGVLCDHYMPGTLGLGFLMEVRHRFPALVTMILTAQADLELVVQAINLGHIHRFWTKPWEPDELRREIRVLLCGEKPMEGERQIARTEDRLRKEVGLARDESGAFLLQDPETL